jgi:hypothetical protein
MPQFLYRSDRNFTDRSTSMFHVVISKPGPRGGKRPPLMDAECWAYDYNDAVEFVEQEFLRGTKTEVSAG